MIKSTIDKGIEYKKIVDVYMCEVLVPYLEILYYVRTLESRFKLIKKLA